MITGKDIPKIEKGIPAPNRVRRGVMPQTLSKMGIGDSILIVSNTKCVTWHVAARKLGMRVQTKREKDGRFRVWRVE